MSKRTGFQPSGFQPGGFQIFGTAFRERKEPDVFFVTKSRKRPHPLQRPIWDQPTPLPDPLELPPLDFIQAEDAPIPDTPVPVSRFDAGDQLGLAEQIHDTQDIQDAIEILSMIGNPAADMAAQWLRSING